MHQSQRDCVFQPRVARHELPWENDVNAYQPQRGCGQWARSNIAAATPLGLFPLGAGTQGSSFLATLGFGPESLWDSIQDHNGSLRVMTRPLRLLHLTIVATLANTKGHSRPNPRLILFHDLIVARH